MTRPWTLAGAFDAGHIRGATPGWERELDFHQLEVTGHAEQLEADYRLFREEFGLRQFRDGAWLNRTLPAPGRLDFGYLDRLAAVSRGEVTLSLCHYEWPRWAEEADLRSGRVAAEMAAYAGQVAARYRGCFAAYIPVVESGYWTAMMTDWGRWWPASRTHRPFTWWQMYATVAAMLVGMARAIREADPEVEIALSEPWAWHPHLKLADQGRPFKTLRGDPDPGGKRALGSELPRGNPALLQCVGLNFYNNWGADQGWPLSRLLLEARASFPGARLVLGETGNCHFSDCHSVADWLALIDEQIGQANAGGADVTGVTWAPILTLGDFDWGEPAPGAWVTWSLDDPGRRRHWEPEVARVVREYAG